MPKDPNEAAAITVTLVTKEADQSQPDQKDAIAQYLATIGRKGGIKGGKARAEKLSDERKSEIAKKAAAARWKKE